MKILIANDNLAVHEILKEILTPEGHEINHVYSVDNARKTIELFDPDIIILDSEINGEKGMDIVNEYDEHSKIGVIILTSDLNFETDNLLVISILQKPFKSKDILYCVNKSNALRKKRMKQKLRISDVNFKKPVVKFGTQYIIFEEKPSFVYKVASLFGESSQILFFTKFSTGKITKNVKGCSDAYRLSYKVNENNVDVRKLGTIVMIAKEFMSEKLQPVVVFDDLKGIIEENGTNATIMMIHQLVSDGVHTVIISTKKDYFSEEEIKTILDDMKECKVS